jgi:hypothetical protein
MPMYIQEGGGGFDPTSDKVLWPLVFPEWILRAFVAPVLVYVTDKPNVEGSASYSGGLG